MLKTEAISKFLSQQIYPLCYHYNPGMEVQINVAKDGGDPISGSYAGKRWHGFTDGLTTWKPFRIPWGSADNPHYEDTDIKFDISKHVEAIGMTGWNWKKKISLWVGFDFDSIIGHKEGLDSNELENIQTKLEELPWITIYTSTSGLGLHVYVYTLVENIVNHTEHAAVARSILDKISALTGLSLKAKVDTLGGNMWIWHRKATPGRSYNIVKEGECLYNIPVNWRDYIPSVSKKKVTHNPQTNIDDIANAKKRLKLDDGHLKLLQWFEKSTALWWFNEHKQMLVCHTYDLKRAHVELSFKGIYETISTGRDQGQDQNCFGFPLEGGAWIIRRHTKGTKEHNSWYIDRSGWTCCFYNKSPTLRTASNLAGGNEGEKEFHFKDLNALNKALVYMDIDFSVPVNLSKKSAQVKQNPDGKLVVSMDRSEGEEIEGWARKKNKWEKVIFKPDVVDDIELPDKYLRHVVSQQTDLGWFIQSKDKWTKESLSHVRPALITLGYKKNELDHVIGQCILNNWTLVNKPLQQEYTGNREWNLNAAQFRFDASEGKHPHWDMVLNHCGETLNTIVQKNNWCANNGINSGYLYLLAWIAALFQYPNEPLPYMFLFGPQNSGKSIFHESLSILFSGGYIRADNSLTSQSGFNGELANAILCVVEETDLSRNNLASDRIKDWVTGRTIAIRALYRETYSVTNCTHWIQCANSPSYCPVFPGDTRIVVIKINGLKKEVAKPLLLQYLENEAPAFIYTLTHFDLPESGGRLRVPVIKTEEKIEQELLNRSALEEFIEEKIFDAPGRKILFSEFYEKFMNWITIDERTDWNKRRVSRSLPFIKGKADGTGNTFIGNISFEKPVEIQEHLRLVLENGRLK